MCKEVRLLDDRPLGGRCTPTRAEPSERDSGNDCGSRSRRGTDAFTKIGAKRLTVLLLGPATDAVSGVSTHLNQLLGSDLSTVCELRHFQVGSEGRSETAAAAVARLLTGPFALARAIIRSRAHIVHINSSMETRAYWRDIGYVAVARLLGRKVVWQVHGGALPKDFLGGALGSWWLRATLRGADAIVVLAQIELEAYREFLPGRDIALIPNAVAAPEASAPRAPAAREPLHLAYVGRLARDKGIFEVVEAVRLLAARGYRARLTIAGSGECDSELRSRVSQSGLEHCVDLVGPIFGAAKSRLWAATDVFAFPTYHREGLPYSLLEAMSAGAVPIVSPVGAIADVVEDGVHGILVPPQDPHALAEAIAALADDRTLLARMSTACIVRASQDYSIARLAREFAALYRRVHP